MAPAFAERLAQLVLRVPEPVHQLPVACRLFDRVQIRALNVLDDRDLKHFGVVEIADEDGHLVQLRALRGAPATLTGDDLVIALGFGIRADDQRLDDPLFADGFAELVQRRPLRRSGAADPGLAGCFPPEQAGPPGFAARRSQPLPLARYPP